MDIRDEEPADETSVRRLHLSAFDSHGPIVAGLAEGLRRAATRQDSLSLVAVEADRVVGHVLFTRNLLDAPRQRVDVYVLSPVGVLPDRQGNGFGSALIKRGLEVLRGQQVPLVFLEGDPGYYWRLWDARVAPGLSGLPASDPVGRRPTRVDIAAGLPTGTHCHELRHFYASLLIDGGESVKVVPSRLGHATADETLNTYARLWPDTEDRSRSAVQAGLAESRKVHRRPRRSSEK